VAKSIACCMSLRGGCSLGFHLRRWVTRKGVREDNVVSRHLPSENYKIKPDRVS